MTAFSAAPAMQPMWQWLYAERDRVAGIQYRTLLFVRPESADTRLPLYSLYQKYIQNELRIICSPGLLAWCSFVLWSYFCPSSAQIAL
jgi:hypothetical protein